LNKRLRCVTVALPLYLYYQYHYIERILRGILTPGLLALGIHIGERYRRA